MLLLDGAQAAQQPQPVVGVRHASTQLDQLGLELPLARTCLRRSRVGARSERPGPGQLLPQAQPPESRARVLPGVPHVHPDLEHGIGQPLGGRDPMHARAPALEGRTQRGAAFRRVGDVGFELRAERAAPPPGVLGGSGVLGGAGVHGAGTGLLGSTKIGPDRGLVGPGAAQRRSERADTDDARPAGGPTRCGPTRRGPAEAGRRGGAGCCSREKTRRHFVPV